MNIKHLKSMPLWQMTGEEFLTLQMSVTNDENISNSTQSQETEYVYGLKGIQELLNCSKSKANRIKKAGVLKDAIIQEGRTIMINKQLAIQLLERNQINYKKMK